ncbi:MAG: iron chaperone [Puniceicoccaceae bacterium]
MNKEVNEYFEAVPDSRRPGFISLHDSILEEFPDATVDMKYRMPTYSYNEGWVAIANQKNYMSLYTCGYHHIKEFKETYPKIKTGKGCINFKEKDILPLADIKKVIRHAILHPKDVGA